MLLTLDFHLRLIYEILKCDGTEKEKIANDFILEFGSNVQNDEESKRERK